MSDNASFKLSTYTQATLRMNAQIEYRGKSSEEVFTIMGDPERITDWYLLAKEVKLHPKGEGPEGEEPEQTFNVEFTFFGDVFEEVLFWDPPHRYAYLARGHDFPIKDYVALIEIEETGIEEGIMRWKMYFDHIEGEHYKRILPVILPEINRVSMEQLCKLIGGISCKVDSYFD